MKLSVTPILIQVSGGVVTSVRMPAIMARDFGVKLVDWDNVNEEGTQENNLLEVMDLVQTEGLVEVGEFSVDISK